MSVFVTSVMVLCVIGSAGSFGLVLAAFYMGSDETGIPTNLPLAEEEAPLWAKVMNA